MGINSLTALFSMRFNTKVIIELNLETLYQKTCRVLSGGEMQRIAIGAYG